MQIEHKQNYRIALLHLGFRPFFLLAGSSAVVLMALWAGLFAGKLAPLTGPWSNSLWHAHEMIFGYCMAVVVGFLLTATRNWTGVQTLHGMPLLVLALLWLLARLLPWLADPRAPYAMALLDIGFNLWFGMAILIPIAKVRQWQQLGICLLTWCLMLSNGLFYLGMLGVVAAGVSWGLYGGLYLIVTLILLMGRRVIPFFIERGAGQAVTVVNHRWADIAGIVLMLSYVIIDVFTPYRTAAAVLAVLLAGVHGYILWGWYTPALWRKSLLWILFLGYGWLVLGFALRGLTPLLNTNPMLAVHAFAVGGIGLITIGMMSRVALGHTGRDVSQPPMALHWLFLLLLSSAITRVGLAWAVPALYASWIILSQVLWLAAFGIFSWIYLPMLVKPRTDGTYG